MTFPLLFERIKYYHGLNWVSYAKKQLSPGCLGYQHFGLNVQLLYGT